MARTKRQPSFSWVLLLLIAGPRAQPSGAPASVFDSVLPELKRQTQIPILLPDHLPPLGGAQVFANAEGQAERYAVRLESDPDCDHAQVCFQGIFRARKGGEFSFPEVVQIGKTAKGRFKATSCGGSCSPPAIEWKLNGVLYTVQLNLLTKDEREGRATMIKVAQNAILRGPI
jgi:hypothetical protein